MMATYTTNYNLKKPAASDTVDISDINGNMDTIDTTLKGLSDDKLAKVTSTDGYNRLYGVDTTGAQQTVPYSSGAYANTLVYRTTDGKTSVGTPTADAHATTKKYVDDGLATKLGKTATADKAKGLIYLEPTVTTTGVLWSATSTDITSYYDGLMLVIRCPEATATGLTLKVNSLTAPTIVYNATSGISTRYSADSIIILVYKTIDNTGYWSIMDYDANTDTKVRQYQATNNVNYPILTRYNTTDKAGTYEATYARFAPAVTINPSTGNLVATKVNGYTLAGACEKAVGSIASGNTGLVTGGDVYTGLAGKQASMTFTDVTITESE